MTRGGCVGPVCCPAAPKVHALIIASAASALRINCVDCRICATSAPGQPGLMTGSFLNRLEIPDERFDSRLDRVFIEPLPPLERVAPHPHLHRAVRFYRAAVDDAVYQGVVEDAAVL